MKWISGAWLRNKATFPPNSFTNPPTCFSLASMSFSFTAETQMSSMSSLCGSRGASMMLRSWKLSRCTSNVWPVSWAMRSQWRSFMERLAISSNSGQVSLKSSIFFLRSLNACHSFKPFGSLRHLSSDWGEEKKWIHHDKDSVKKAVRTTMIMLLLSFQFHHLMYATSDKSQNWLPLWVILLSSIAALFQHLVKVLTWVPLHKESWKALYWGLCWPVLKVNEFIVDLLNVHLGPQDIIVAINSINHCVVEPIQLLQ